LLTNINIILVETSHAGNIGAVARAMKNMSLSRLRLVSPKLFPHAEATARASGADDILASANIYTDLESAISDCHLVIGASARARTISWPELSPRESAEKCLLQADQKIAIIFGRENSGLKNHELDLCHYLLRIPANEDYSSLNLAAAVQIICYELWVSTQPKPTFITIGDQGERSVATAKQMVLFYQHLQQTLADIGFLHADKSQSIMRRLRRIYNRVQLDTKELDILRGILRFSQNHNQDHSDVH
jgi:tRNA/rRNA methyltransferase/tRNA (cytidine32/uridine32-2'-O)-methyltransferase